ncbi:MAG: hypothetical protein Q8N26_26690 [Myxococcales bacterium]|nr:hypothetical protein [Myxococcales bacterium]
MALDGQSLFHLAIVVAGAVLVWANLWRTLIFVTPSATTLEIEDGSPDAPVPGWLEETHTTLRGLGFAPVGSWLELRRLGPARTSWGYVNETQRVFAIVSDSPLVRVKRTPLTPPEPRLERDGPAARVTFVTVSAASGFLLSSNFRRPGATLPHRHLCAGLPNASAERLFRAHLRRVEELGLPAGTFTLEGLLAHLRDWHASVGRAELQRQHAVGLLWTLGGLGMVAGPLVGRF